MLSRALWKKRLVFWLGAVAVGVGASYFAVFADAAQRIFNDILAVSPFWPLVLTPGIFMVSAALTRRYFPAAAGSGIPQSIAARIVRDAKGREYLLGVKVVLGKVAMTGLGLLGGASIGREGPSVQLGAGILLLCASRAGMGAQRGLVLAGAAAGVAAAFNTPLAGIVFAIEEMARAFEQRNSHIILITIVLSGAAALSILGNYSYFGNADAVLLLSRDWLCIACTGLIGGLAGSVFALLFINGNAVADRIFGGAPSRHPVMFAACCGLLVAVLGYVTHGVTYGAGYRLATGLLSGEVTSVWWQAPAKFLATLLSGISGIPGGIFSPSLSIGAALGGFLSQGFATTPLQGVILLAMVAYFAGVTQAPITAFVIVLEITGKGTMAVPLIAAAVIAAAVSRMLCPVSLYHTLAKRFVLQAKAAAPNPR